MDDDPMFVSNELIRDRNLLLQAEESAILQQQETFFAEKKKAAASVAKFAPLPSLPPTMNAQIQERDSSNFIPISSKFNQSNGEKSHSAFPDPGLFVPKVSKKKKHVQIGFESTNSQSSESSKNSSTVEDRFSLDGVRLSLQGFEKLN